MIVVCGKVILLVCYACVLQGHLIVCPAVCVLQVLLLVRQRSVFSRIFYLSASGLCSPGSSTCPPAVCVLQVLLLVRQPSMFSRFFYLSASGLCSPGSPTCSYFKSTLQLIVSNIIIGSGKLQEQRGRREGG